MIGYGYRWAVAAVFAIGVGGEALASCSLLGDARARMAARDAAGLAELARQADRTPGCPNFAQMMGRAAAMIALVEAKQGGRLNRSELIRIATYGEPWPVLFERAKAERDAGDINRAAEFAEEALADAGRVASLSSADRAREAAPAPSVAQMRTLRKLSDELRLAATLFVGRRSRGACVRYDGSRMATVEPVAVPVTFVFAETTFTEPGVKAAKELAECLKTSEQKITRIKIIGHTDPVGTAANNLKLSRRRAEAVRRYLLAEFGRAPRFVVEASGEGEARPFEPSDPTAYSQKQLYQMHRRVEVDVTYQKTE